MKQSSKRPWLVFIGCCVISLIGMGLVMNTAGLYYSSLTAEFGVSTTVVAGSMAAMTMAMMIGMAVIGKMMGKISVKVLVSVCCLLTGGGLMVCSLASSMALIYIGQIFVGIGLVLLPGILTNILLGNWFVLKLGTVLGLTAGVSGLGGAVFNPMVSFFITEFGWRNAYRLTGLMVIAICIPIAVFTLKFAPEGEETAYGAGKQDKNGMAASDLNVGMTFGEAVRSYKFYLVLLAASSLSLLSGFVQQISNHVISIGYTLTVGASVMSGVMIGIAAGKFIMGFLLDAIKPVYALIAYMLMGVAGWIGFTMVDGQAMLIGAGVLVGMGQAILLVAVPFVSRKVYGGKAFATISAIQGIVTGLVSVFSSILMAGMFDATGSYNSAFILAGVLYLIGTPAAIIAYLKRSDYSKA